MDFCNKHILIVGIGRTGLATAHKLKTLGAFVVYYDDDPKNSGAEVINHIDESKLQCFDFVCISPGIPFLWPTAHKLVTMARKCFVPIINDLDIFTSFLQNHQKVIAITGTNGKSTTTALTYHILKTLNYKVAIGGNIGIPLLELPNDADIYVLEISSYQIEASTNFRFHSAALLNITPDHLKRHGGIYGYAYAKQKVFANSDTYCVVGTDDTLSATAFDTLSSFGRNVVPISGKRYPTNGIGWLNNSLFNGKVKICDAFSLLDGEHNRQNIAATYALVKNVGVTDEQFSETLTSFNGLEHRQEVIKRHGTTFVNDSKATNAEATEHAIKRFIDSDILWIAGGIAKEGGISILKPYFSKIKEAFLIGHAATDFSNELCNNVHHVHSGTLDVAIKQAYVASKKYKNPVVLFSPACASFDQFKNFEDRGNKFKNFVQHLEEH